MSDHSAIEWTDATWNPVTGCDEVSPGCDHCYAKTFAERFRGTPGHYFETGFDVQLRPDKLRLPFTWRKPRKVFVNSMSDLFHKDVPDDYIAQVFAVMALTPEHTYQLLTKRHGRMRSLLSAPEFRAQVARAAGQLAEDGDIAHDYVQFHGWPLPNVWLGVSVEDQQRANLRITALLDTPAAVRFLSCEPLLGPVDLRLWLHYRPIGANLAERPMPPSMVRACGLTPLDWVIVGGESGRGARPMHPDWARALRDQCAEAEVPFLFKQWGEFGQMTPLDGQGRFDHSRGVTVADDGTVYQQGDLAFPDGPRYGEAVRAGHEKAHLTGMYRVGKKAAGRELDGRTHDEFPPVLQPASRPT